MQLGQDGLGTKLAFFGRAQAGPMWTNIFADTEQQ